MEIGIYWGWWSSSNLPAWMQALQPRLAATPKNALTKAQTLLFPEPPKTPEPTLVYVEVDPALATTEAPRETAFYSARNSLAANPDPQKDTPTPKVDGKQTKVIKTVDTLRPNPKPLNEPEPEPLPPPKKAEDPVAAPPVEKIEPKTAPKVEPEPKAEEGKPQEKVVTGDTVVATAQPQLAEPTAPREPNPATPQPPRRRTLPPEKRQMGMLAGQKMQQEGGVKRRGLVSSLDVKESPFGNYDELVIIAIQQRWFDLLDQQDFTRGRTGKVVLEFRMMADGKVTNMRVAECDVGDLLAIVCQKAVLDPSPYAPWPPEMKRKIGVSFREVRFTFYYE